MRGDFCFEIPAHTLSKPVRPWSLVFTSWFYLIGVVFFDFVIVVCIVFIFAFIVLGIHETHTAIQSGGDLEGQDLVNLQGLAILFGTHSN